MGSYRDDIFIAFYRSQAILHMLTLFGSHNNSMSTVIEIFVPFRTGERRDSKGLGLAGPHNSCVTEQAFIPCRISTALDLGVSPNKDTVS